MLDVLSVYEKNGIRVHMALERTAENPTLVTATLIATSSPSCPPVSDFLFQVAIPTSMTLHMPSASGTLLASLSPVTQVLLIENPSGVRDLIRILFLFNFQFIKWLFYFAGCFGNVDYAFFH